MHNIIRHHNSKIRSNPSSPRTFVRSFLLCVISSFYKLLEYRRASYITTRVKRYFCFMAKKRKRERERERETSSRGASWNTSEKSNFVETNFRINRWIRKIWWSWVDENNWRTSHDVKFISKYYKDIYSSRDGIIRYLPSAGIESLFLYFRDPSPHSPVPFNRKKPARESSIIIPGTNYRAINNTEEAAYAISFN